MAKKIKKEDILNGEEMKSIGISEFIDVLKGAMINLGAKNFYVEVDRIENVDGIKKTTYAVKFEVLG